MSSRNLIGQAQGILMAGHGFTADQAFTVLRTQSQNQNVRLVTLAEQITRTGHLPGTDQDRPPDQPGRRTRRSRHGQPVGGHSIRFAPQLDRPVIG